jgi:hypothetical protein
MEKALVERLEAAVARLEAAVASGASLSAAPRDLGDGLDAAAAASDPAIVAYDEFVAGAVGRLTAAAEKIGGKVLDATKVLAEAFAVSKDRLVQAKQLQVRGAASLMCSCLDLLDFGCARRVDLPAFRTVWANLMCVPGRNLAGMTDQPEIWRRIQDFGILFIEMARAILLEVHCAMTCLHVY